MNSQIASAYVFRASPPGQGAIHLLWLWGARSQEVLQKLFPQSSEVDASRSRVMLARLFSSGETLDEAMWRRLAPQETFLPQPAFEISLHGSQTVLARAIEACCEQGASLLDTPAFLAQARERGAMDRCREEAWTALAQARTAAAAKLFLAQAQGALSEEIERLLQISQTGEPSHRLLASLEALLLRAPAGVALHTPHRLVLCGPPNAGKSTLFNALVGYERAIVSPQAGTTRDRVEEAVDLGGYPFYLVDTAGLRESKDALENAGAALAIEEASRADLILFVWDATRAWDESQQWAIERLPAKKLLRVSAKREPLALLVAELEKQILQELSLPFPAPESGPVPFTQRQAALLQRATEEVRDGAEPGLTLQALLK